MGKSTVFVNGQGMSSSKSDAITVSGPDVCLTPAGPAMVPVPYINVAKSASLENGSRTVKVNGGMGAIDGCCYSKSTGDEPGSGRGVGSGTVGGKAEFANCSFDVTVEGKGACRNTDLMTQNNRNAIGMNQDTSAPPPVEDLKEKPQKGTFQFRVVEHLSWDERSKSYKIGHKDNRPIPGLKFKIRKLSDDSDVERITDDNGVIELTAQDPDSLFEITFEPEDAQLNNKYYLFYNKVFQLEKKVGNATSDDRKTHMEQNDPKGQTLKSVKSKLACDGFHQISILQYSVVVDSHMHIESGRCAPLQWMQDLSVLTKKATRRCLENVGEFGGYLIEAGGLIYRLSELFWNPMAGWRDLQKDLEENDGRYKSPTRHIRNLTQQSSKSTELIADDFIGKRSKVYEWLQKERLYSGISNLMVFSVVMTMDMEYAHVDGYFGLKLYNALYRTLEDIEKLEPCAYWCPVHGHWEKQPPPLKGTYVKEKIVRNEDGDVYHRTGSDGHPAHPVLQKDFQSVEKATLVGSYFDTNTNKTVQVAIDSVPVLTSSDETKKYEQWEKQLKNTELAVLKYPLKFLPMFHYDPRRWQPGNSNDFPMRQVSDEGLYLGFKMYTAQGYRPLDRRLPIMRDFYEQCSARRIPIMNHCTPDGAATFERKEYMKFVHWNDTREDKWQESRDAEAYFNERFVSPHAWQEVLDRYDLHLCLAHFGGPTELGMHWNEDLIDMIESGDYPNLYTDISSSFACDAFRNNFKSIIQKHPRLRDRILFGTDWYMTLSYTAPFVGKDFKQYCRDTKICLDDFDTSLWPRFTQYNPFRFYRLEEQVDRIARNIIARRATEKVREDLKELSREKINKIWQEVAYIKVANTEFVNYEEAS